jgi:hypothetical protein
VTRRALGRGRFLIVGGSLITLVGMVPAWWVVERTGQADLTGNGFEGAGLVVFLAALLLLALVVLPFASRDGDSPLDRAPTYIIVALLGIAAYLFRVYQIMQFGGLSLTESIGLWITGAGLLVVAWGAGDILTEKARDTW